MARRNIKVWAAVIAGLLALVGTVAALTVPRFLGQTSAAPTPAPAEPSASASTTPPAGAGGSPSVPATGSATSGPAPSSVPPPAASPPARSRAAALLASMSLEQQVGQVMMVSSPVAGPDAATLGALRRLKVGNVFLKGRTTAGAAAVARVVAALKGEATEGATRGVGQFIATDQEGGQVQIMRGPGFSDMPAALAQGTMAPAALRQAAAGWGRELASAGVNVNLAPVMDTVPSAGFASQNAPIGAFQREFGYMPEAVSAHGLAFAQGMADAGVAATPKHFPGLGRVTANTDTASGVEDSTTGRHDAYVGPFAEAVRAGVTWVMVSNALYPQIDRESYAVFSPTVIGGMLRGDLGFRGIIVSDDVCDAVQFSGVPPEHRGAAFLAAGGTMVLCTNAELAPRIWAGIVDRATGDAGFAATVSAAALAVLEAKDQAGLLPH
ncbi:glycoside hydrolase family 3 protein [Sinomonas notoginsengisoli]|uniref:glycoside hydrolase family 3 N-terminal domain-containing protein n=1 Tax=Sinomonas notoginsengisoli TaxID=1457311 RepID=UPI001F37B2C9|nr:glycoside hydrolase family 3 N-terminal domain-containing protein [Sinomonas notoginsengisoli]